MSIGFEGSVTAPAEGGTAEYEVTDRAERGTLISRIALGPGLGLTNETILSSVHSGEDPFQSSGYPDYFYFGGKKHDHYCKY